MPEQKYKIHEIIDIVSKGGVALLAVSYFFGFIIVNVHLARFGITDLALIKSKYIAAGLLYLFFLFGNVVFVILGISMLHTIKSTAKRLVIAILIIFLLILLPFLIIDPALMNRPLKLWCYGYMLYNIVLCLIVLFVLQVVQSASNVPRLVFAGLSIGILSLLVSSILFFGTIIYPKICTHYGGGRLLQVQITYDNKSLSSSLHYMLSMFPIETYLLTQDAKTTKIYIVLDGIKETYDATVSLSRTVIKSMAFLGESIRSPVPRGTIVAGFEPSRPNLYKIAQIFTDVCDNTENPKQEKVLKSKLKNINLSDEEIEYFVNLFREVATEVQKSL